MVKALRRRLGLDESGGIPRSGETGRFWLWAGLYAAFVVYGSLIPFAFRALPLGEAVRQFEHIPYLRLGVEHRADWVANILLYIPLAAFLSAALAAHRRPAWVAWAIFLACSGFAVALEFLQIFFPRRTASLNDIFAESLGSGLGVLIWLAIGPRFDDIRRALRIPGARAPRILAGLYALAYLGLVFFPLDILISIPELHWKYVGGNAGIWLAPNGCARAFSCTGTRVAEILAAVPLGAGLGLWLPREPRREGLLHAARIALAVGFGIEVLQFFTASNISQGISGLSRSIGIVLGYGLYRLGRRDWPARSLLTLRRRAFSATLALCYAGASLYLSLAGKGPWLPPGAILARLQRLHFLPFWYHYYTSETRALESFLLNFGLYVPIGVLVYSAAAAAPSRREAGLAAALGLLWGLALETGKLSLRLGRPDPSNILIAAAGAGFGCWLASRLLPSTLLARPAETPRL